MSESMFKKVDREATLSSKIEDQIREAIRQNVFVAGDKLPGEIQLAERFGVSRTAVREAMHILAGRGLVDIRKGSGIYVAEFDVSNVIEPFYQLLELKCGDASMHHLIHVRQFIEPELARLAAENYEAQDIQFLKQYLDNMKNLVHNPKEMINQDIKFHRRIATATENPILSIIMEPIYELMDRFISDTYPHSNAPELALYYHQTILNAIEQKDGEEAYRQMKEHLEIAEQHAIDNDPAHFH